MNIPQITIARLMILVAMVAGVLGLDRLFPLLTRVVGYYLVSGAVGWFGWRICRQDLQRGPRLILGTYALDVLVACCGGLTRLANPWLTLAGAMILTHPWVMGCALGWLFNSKSSPQNPHANRWIIFEAVFIMNPVFLLTILYVLIQFYAIFALLIWATSLVSGGR